MATNDKIIIALLFVLSMLLFVSTAAACMIRIIKGRRSPEKVSKAGVGTALAFSAAVLFSIGFMKYAVGYYGIAVPKPDVQPLVWWEELVSCFLASLKTFGMAEDYGKLIREINNIVPQLLPAGSAVVLLCQVLLCIHASVLTVCAPVVAGALIVEVMAGVFPKVRLWWAYLNPRSTKCFFSELNASSLILAKSIYATRKGENPVLIFTNTATDKKARSQENQLEAKRYGTICISDDLVHIAKPRFGKREYYLMDEKEFSNLQTLTELIEDRNIKALADSYIYLFVESDAYVQIEKHVNLALEGEQKKALLKGGQKPVIVPIHGYRNLVHNLLIDLPLYEPLVNKADPTKLNVSILGNGSIGTEAFLSVYWFGQMMVSRKDSIVPCDLTVNVISKEPEKAFWSKIDYINPEIKQTVEVLSGAGSQPGDVLCYDSTGAKTPPYCRVRYIQADMKAGNLWTGNDEDTQHLLQTDYFIVVLGSDADNISVAEALCRGVGKHHLENLAKDNKVKNTVIAYAVFDSGLANTLNKHKRYQTCKADATDVYMYAFGSMAQVYSCDNVYMSKSSLLAEETGHAYLKAQNADSYLADNKARSQNGQSSNYGYWANLARASHMKYKVFSLGWIESSVFSDCTDEADERHREQVQQICADYKRIAIANSIDESDVLSQKLKAELEQKKHCLAWLEHRRWNAFTRTMGYRYTDAENILAVKNSQKDMELKLHACLVEARQPAMDGVDTYIYADFKANGKVDQETTFEKYTTLPLDRLDMVSDIRRKYNPGNAGDFKVYDYYRYEFDDYLSLEEFAALIGEDEKTLADRCKRGVYANAVCFRNGDAWYIPFESAKPELLEQYRQLGTKDAALIEKCKAGQCQGVELFDTWFVAKSVAEAQEGAYV